MRRGDLVVIAVSGDYGKPRPAVVIQDDAFNALPSLVILRITSELHDWPLLRITVEPTSENGLQKPSQVMIDKPAAVPKARIGPRIGHLDGDLMSAIDTALARFLGLP